MWMSNWLSTNQRPPPAWHYHQGQLQAHKPGKIGQHMDPARPHTLEANLREVLDGKGLLKDDYDSDDGAWQLAFLFGCGQAAAPYKQSFTHMRDGVWCALLCALQSPPSLWAWP